VSRALILSCSRSKRPDEHRLSAVERYDGPAFKVLRRYLRESNATLAVRILSAEFGLIGPEEHVGLYDRRMTDCRARELEPAVTAAFELFWRSNEINDLMLLTSKVYALAMTKCWSFLSDDVQIHTPSGSIGRRVAQLHDWLYGEPPSVSVVVSGHVKFRGTSISVTSDEVLALARSELPNDAEKAAKFESWCVPIDERSVAPKWLVSKLSGVPVSGFRTADALHVLKKLGVEVKRVPPRNHERNVAKEAL
jgi:hypothetical protein